MAAYVLMRCTKCRRTCERYANARYCSTCAGKLVRIAPGTASPRKKPSRFNGQTRQGNDSFRVRLGSLVRTLRLRKNMTMRDLRKKARISLPMLSDVENGWRGIGLENFCRLALALGEQPGRMLARVGALAVKEKK